MFMARSEDRDDFMIVSNVADQPPDRFDRANLSEDNEADLDQEMVESVCSDDSEDLTAQEEERARVEKKAPVNSFFLFPDEKFFLLYH